jgi:hypothetical protein
LAILVPPKNLKFKIEPILISGDILSTPQLFDYRLNLREVMEAAIILGAG